MKSLTLIEITQVLDMAWATGLITSEQEIDLIGEMTKAFDAKYCPVPVTHEFKMNILREMRNDPKQDLQDEINSVLRNALYDNN